MWQRKAIVPQALSQEATNQSFSEHHPNFFLQELEALSKGFLVTWFYTEKWALSLVILFATLEFISYCFFHPIFHCVKQKEDKM